MWKAKDLFLIEVPKEDVPFTVPYEAWTEYVGPDYVRQLADKLRGDYIRDPENIGLIDDFTILQGRWLDPTKVHPLIVEFYEHTSRFTLAVRPSWHLLFQPLFWLFRRFFAARVGQFNLPFDIHEAQKGIESHIDCIDFKHDKIRDIRAWIRTYIGTETVVYVGIYTTIRLNNLGYVSVGFPFPSANLTATLVPTNRSKQDFLLKSRKRRARFAGDYLVFADLRTRALSVFRIWGLSEQIHVYVRKNNLFTDHRFYFLGCKFLTLHYTITRKAAPAPEAAQLPQRPAMEDLLMQAPTLKRRSDPSLPNALKS